MIESIILGLIQALSEFLPVSSSGHLRIAEYFLNFHFGNILSFEIALHFGTFCATFLVFFQDIKEAITGFFSGLKDVKTASKENEGFRMAVMVIIASIPTAIAGLILEPYIEAFPLKRIGINLVITGGVLLMTRKYDLKTEDRKDVFSTTLLYSFFIGCAQAVAIFPGISRSGMTISMALFLGLNRSFAGKLSFLISLPAIFGALILSIKNLIDFNITYALLGFFTAFIFGYMALKFLLSFLKKGKLYYFGFYCITVGVAVFLYFTVGA